MPRVVIEDLEWDEDNEDHVEKHPGMTVDTVYDMIEGGDWVQVRNKRNHPPRFIRLIGCDREQSMLVVILAPTRFINVWRPITAYWAGKSEADLYNRQRRKHYVH